MLSAILRLDVDRPASPTQHYSVPPDNPFVGRPGVRPEIWAFGFRNPWKMSFGPDGRLWCGDVGWELWEMVHLVQRGGNYGWSAMEASQPIKPETISLLAPITPPAIAHPHHESSSITGGYVYQGRHLPGLRGAYVYGDYDTGKIWALWHDGTKIVRHEEIADTPHRIATFGLLPDGELIYSNYGTPGTLHRLVPNPVVATSAAFPRLLSKTGLFRDTAAQVPAAGVYDFEIAEPLWEDGATARRFLALPGDSSIGFEGNRRALWPAGAVLARTVEDGDVRLETQLLHFDGEAWNGYAYRWNEAGDDAELVPASGRTVKRPDGRSHAIASRSACLRCHTLWAGYALGFQPVQLTQIDGHPADEAARALGGGTHHAAVRRHIGDAYTEFLREARALLHAHGRQIGVHLLQDYVRPPDDTGRARFLGIMDHQWEEWVRNIADFAVFRGPQGYRWDSLREVTDHYSAACRAANIPLIFQANRRLIARLRTQRTHPDPNLLEHLRREFDFVLRHPGVHAYQVYETANLTWLDEDNRLHDIKAFSDVIRNASFAGR